MGIFLFFVLQCNGNTVFENNFDNPVLLSYDDSADDEGAPVKRAKEAVQKTAQARNIELAKDLLSEGETIERTVRLSKLSEAEVRELASKLTA